MEGFMILPDSGWVKAKGYQPSKVEDKAIMVTVVGNVKRTINFTFRDNTWKKIFGNHTHGTVQLYKNRIFFKGVERGGFKLCEHSKPDTRIMKVSIYDDVPVTKELAKYAGFYDLEHDEFYDLYYLEGGVN